MRQGTHWPQVSSRKKAAMRSRMRFRSTVSSNSITTPDPRAAPIERVPSKVSGVSSSPGVTNAPAAPPSSTACKRPLPATPPARPMSSRSVGPKGISYTPGRATWPERQYNLYPVECAVPMRA